MGRYFSVNSIFAKISSREHITNLFFAEFFSRENNVFYRRTYSSRRRQLLSADSPGYSELTKHLSQVASIAFLENNFAAVRQFRLASGK